MKLIFSCLGFATNDAFLVKDGRQLKVGTVVDTWPDGHLEFWPDMFCVDQYVKRDGYITLEEIPTITQAIEEYTRQLDARKGRSFINRDILYAG